MKNNNIDLVTIVTVTYNAQDLLEETILSVINQSYENIEYIIIDGASTDGTLDIIKRYEDHLDYWISEPDDGIYFAMNKAIEKATGTWINFMNAGDTFADNDTINYVMNKVDENTDLIYGDHISNGTICSVDNRQIITRTLPCCHQSLFTRTALMKENPFNTFYSISADYDFLLQMYQKGGNFKYIQEPFAKFASGGLSEQNVLQQKLESLTVLMNNHVEFNEVINSASFKYIQNSGSRNDINKQLEEIEIQLRQLQNLIHKVSSIKMIFHPFKKYRAYKRLLKAYQEVK